MRSSMKEQLELLEALKERIEDGDIKLTYKWSNDIPVAEKDLHPLQDLLDHYNILILYWLNDKIDILRDKSKFEGNE